MTRREELIEKLSDEMDKDGAKAFVDEVIAEAGPIDFNAHTLTVAFNRFLSEDEWRQVVEAARLLPFAEGLTANAVSISIKEPPLLQCVDCKNTESCAGAMARQFNHGRCMHCGGYFKVVRA
jgi:hypothetical protein